ncbi:MAG TPA: hypothetical protein VEZ72_03055, partial [Paenibacillus sp.]|nr:hypothetical protein [Paenibacillus sp.]
ASGNTATQLISIPYYKSAFLWSNAAYGPGYQFATFDVRMKEFDEIAGEASVEVDDSLIPPGITANGYFSAGALRVTLHGSEGTPIGAIPSALPVVFTVQSEERILELPLVFRKSAGGPNPPATKDYMYQLGLTAEEAAEHPTFNQPIDLKSLFGDPDMIVGDELTYTITGISPALPIEYDLDPAEGKLSLAFDSTDKQNGLGSPDYVMNVRAADSTGNFGETSIRIDMNEAPMLLQDGPIVFYGDDRYNRRYLHSIVQDDGGIGGLTKAFDPPEAADAAGASFGLESSTMALIVEGHPTETQTFDVTFADGYGRKAAQQVTVIAPELKTLEVDSPYAYVNLDVLFQEPENNGYTYDIINASGPWDYGYTVVTGNYLELYSLSEDHALGTISVSAETADGVRVKDIRFTVTLGAAEPDNDPILLEPFTVTGDVYTGSIEIGDIFPDGDILPSDAYYYISSDDSLTLAEFNPITNRIVVTYHSEYISDPYYIHLTIVRLRDGVARLAEFTLTHMPPV